MTRAWAGDVFGEIGEGGAIGRSIEAESDIKTVVLGRPGVAGGGIHKGLNFEWKRDCAVGDRSWGSCMERGVGRDC